MKLVFGSFFLMFAVAAAAAPAGLLNDPSATTPEQSASLNSGAEGSTAVSVLPSPDPTLTSDPSATNTSLPSPTSSDVNPTSTDSSVSTPATSVEVSPTETQPSSTDAPTAISTHDSPTPSSDAPTTTPEQPSTTSSDVSPTSDVPPPTQTSTPSSSAAAPQPTTAPPPVDQQTYLDQHNLWRRTVGAGDLQWSPDLAAKAQSYAEGCQLKHSDGALGPVGESLAAATGSFNAKDAVDLFVQDMNDFSPARLNLNHFTQVIWRSTTQLGCGVAICPSMFPGDGDATYHVCLYDPVGNVVGEEKQNLP